MAVQRFHIALFAVAAVAAGVLLTDPALAQTYPTDAYPSDQGQTRDDPDAFAPGWRRVSYEAPAPRTRPAAERSGQRRTEPAKRDFVSELLGPTAESMRRMP